MKKLESGQVVRVYGGDQNCYEFFNTKGTVQQYIGEDLYTVLIHNSRQIHAFYRQQLRVIKKKKLLEYWLIVNDYGDPLYSRSTYDSALSIRASRFSNCHIIRVRQVGSKK